MSCSELFDSTPDHHVEKFCGTYLCNYYALAVPGMQPDTSNLERDSVLLVISKSSFKNEVYYSNPGYPLYQKPVDIQYDGNLKKFLYSSGGGNHMHTVTSIQVMGDSISFWSEFGMFGAERANVLLGKKIY